MRESRKRLRMPSYVRVLARAVAALVLAISLASATHGVASAVDPSFEEEYPVVAYGDTYAGGWQTPTLAVGVGPTVPIADATALRGALNGSSAPGTTYVLADGSYQGVFTASPNRPASASPRQDTFL